MPKYLAAVDLNRNELRNARVQNLATAPATPVVGQMYYDTVQSNLFFYDGTAWRAAFQDNAFPIGPAGGDLTGTFPAPQIGSGVIDDANVAADAAIALSKLATDPLARANHTGTQLAESISDFDAAVQANSLDELTAPVASVSFNGQRATGLADPVGPQDAATKSYVDAASMGLDVKPSVRATTTGNITLSGPMSLDGVTVHVGDRVLVKDQDDATENGIYVVATGAWVRSSDADSAAEVTSGMYTFVEEGDQYADSGFILTTDGAVNLGASDLSFTQFTGAGQLTPGGGLTKNGNIMDVGGTADRISVFPDSIDIASTYVGQASITTLGTIETGTWEADTLTVEFGGTGGTTPATARAGIGAVGKFVGGNGGTTTDVLVHGLGSSDVTVSIREVSTGTFVEADVTVTDANTVTVTYASPMPANALRITVIG